MSLQEEEPQQHPAMFTKKNNRDYIESNFNHLLVSKYMWMVYKANYFVDLPSKFRFAVGAFR